MFRVIDFLHKAKINNAELDFAEFFKLEKIRFYATVSIFCFPLIISLDWIDNISSNFMKLALPYIDTSLAFLFNTSIETSQFPDSWKVARITPIFKDGDRAEKSNYRPISVLPVISKLFEKLVFNQLYQYMNENGIFTSDQSGFLRLHSTLTCLLNMSDDWYNGLDLGKLV